MNYLNKRESECASKSLNSQSCKVLLLHTCVEMLKETRQINLRFLDVFKKQRKAPSRCISLFVFSILWEGGHLAGRPRITHVLPSWLGDLKPTGHFDSISKGIGQQDRMPVLNTTCQKTQILHSVWAHTSVAAVYGKATSR